MATRQQFVTHVFGGGWGPAFGPYAAILIPQNNVVVIPYLWEAENIIYEYDGGPRTAPGADKLNSSAVTGSVIKGLYDYWITGTAGSPTQKRIIYCGSGIFKDDADGTFDSLFADLNTGEVITFAQLNDLLVMGLSGSDTPKSWDGTTAQDLAGSPPNFSIVVEHKNRLWATGVDSNPSRLYYSGLLDPTCWSGSGSGFIDISPDDGDSITALASHRDELFIFKGPYKGSIHRLAGSAPTGSDAFSRIPFAKNIGAIGHNTLFRFGNDLGFQWSDGTINALSAIERFGDFDVASLSRPIDTYLSKHLNFDRLKHGWAASNCNDCGFVLFTLPIDNQTNNTLTLMMDYRFSPPRWSYWKAFESGCIADVIDASDNNRRIYMAGGNDGFVRKYMRETRNIDGSTAIVSRATTPFIDYSNPIATKTLYAVGMILQPKTANTYTFEWKSDGNPPQTITLGQNGGTALDTFTLDTHYLADNQALINFTQLETGGEFRMIRYTVKTSTTSDDLALHALGAAIEINAWSAEN